MSYADENDGYKYLLAVIDIFSRYGWVEPIKDETAVQVISAFDKIFKKGRKPRCLQSDVGKEFTNKAFSGFLKK